MEITCFNLKFKKEKTFYNVNSLRTKKNLKNKQNGMMIMPQFPPPYLLHFYKAINLSSKNLHIRIVKLRERRIKSVQAAALTQLGRYLYAKASRISLCFSFISFHSHNRRNKIAEEIKLCCIRLDGPGMQIKYTYAQISRAFVFVRGLADERARLEAHAGKIGVEIWLRVI